MKIGVQLQYMRWLPIEFHLEYLVSGFQFLPDIRYPVIEHIPIPKNSTAIELFTCYV